MKNVEIRLKSVLKPLYSSLLDGIKFSNICAFCVQWGSDFSDEEKSGILFVGKAVNSWKNDETDIETLFGNSDYRIFAREDQMKWVHNQEVIVGSYIKKSAFWRVIKRISQKYYPTDWYNNVAWSNLCKIAPFIGGNPSDSLYYYQLPLCQQILSKEIEILSPKVIVLFTSGWEKDFLFYLNDNNEPQIEMTINWYGYETKLYFIKGNHYIVSPHPQGKAEDKHVEVIIELIDSLK